MDSQSLYKVESYLKLYPYGVEFNKLQTDLLLDQAVIVEAINTLIEQNRLISEKSKTGEHVFKLLTEKELLKLKDLTEEDQRVYEVILSAGNNGITLNELKANLHITSNLLQKIRKKLEKKLLVKNITVPNMKNKKVILAYDIEPSNELKGGFWCSNQQFNKSLIDSISNKITEYLSKQENANRKEILVYIKSTGLVNEDIKEEDIQSILNILIFDDKIDIVFTGSKFYEEKKYIQLLKKGNFNTTNNNLSILNDNNNNNNNSLSCIKYKIIPNYFEDLNILEYIPCTYCPIFNQCNINNIVNPLECVHMNYFYDEL